ncbi:MAG: hypothetical protein JXM69_21370 [Anaerolineae bacterium]|nr:hypothetical protein [Anaerolineae bacterium]
MRRGEAAYYLSGDHPSALLRTNLRSVSLTIRSDGDRMAEARYLPYGQQRWTSGLGVTDFGFTAQRADRLVCLNPLCDL